MKLKKLLEDVREDVVEIHEIVGDLSDQDFGAQLSDLLELVRGIRAEQQRVQAPIGKASPKPTIKNILEMHRDYLHKHLCHPEYVDCMITHINNLQKQVDDLTARNSALEATIDRRRSR